MAMKHPMSRHRRPLTLDEVKRLLAATHGYPDEALLIVALATGLRRGELLALRWSDLDVAQGTLTVRRTLNREGYEAEPKTGSREMLLPGFLTPIFQQHRRLQDEARPVAGAEWQERDLVFANATGGLLDPTHLSRVVREVASQAGVPSLSFHTLRQTTASLLWDTLGYRHRARPHSQAVAQRREVAANLDALFRSLLPEGHSGLPDAPSLSPQ